MRHPFLAFICCVLAIGGVVAPGGTASARAGGIAFVINANSASISVIDMARPKGVGRSPALGEPHPLALGPKGRGLVGGDTAGHQMLFLDPETGAVQKPLPVGDPYQLQFSP